MTDPNLQPSAETAGDAPARKRPKHLMDPANPRPPAYHGRGMSLTHVQMWVMSVLAVTTALHFSGGLVLAAFFKDGLVAQVGLLVIAGLFGVLSVLAARAIHRKPLLSWWLVIGWVPTVVGGYFLFR